MKRLKQASRFLSQFNFRGITYCDMAIYIMGGGCPFQGFGPRYNSREKQEIWNWSATDWEEYIKGFIKEDRYDLEEMEVAAIDVAFRVEGDKQIYSIESTDFQQNQIFDRIIIHSTDWSSPTYEVLLTAKESASIHGVADVVKLTHKVSKTRYNIVTNDLPVAVNKDRSGKTWSSDGLA